MIAFLYMYRQIIQRKGMQYACFYLLAGLVTIVVGGCSSRQTTFPAIWTSAVEPEPAKPIVTVIEEELENEIITRIIERDDEIIVVDDPWILVERANQDKTQYAPSLLISAIAGFIATGQLFTAENLIDHVITYPLTPAQTIYLELQRIKLSQISGKHQYALRILNQLNISELNIPLRAEKLQLVATSQIELNQLPEALQTLISRDLILSENDQIANQQKILDLLRSMDIHSLSLLKESTANRAIQGWVALSGLLQSQNHAQLSVALEQWKLNFPTHPLHTLLFQQYLEISQIQKFHHVALLLPLTSPYGEAAKAFHDGFIAARDDDSDANAPLINLLDIGDNPALSMFYYKAAINDGADFIVGPLGRRAVQIILDNQYIETPTLVIADIPDGQSQINLYGISLSPEKEAEQTARKAYADGHRSAMIFWTDSNWGKRVATAFKLKWEKLGGSVVKNSSFPDAISGYSHYPHIIQKLIGIDKSIERQELLSAQVGVNLEFTPRRRDDMDFIFLAANTVQARLVVPQLKFFQAHNLPIYSTSYIYLGEPNPSVDTDLDGLVFGEISWILDGVNHYRQKVAAKKETETQAVSEFTDTEVGESMGITKLQFKALSDTNSTEEATITVQQNNEIESNTLSPHSPYPSAALDRLYALGFQSYQLIPKLKILRQHNWARYNGKMMTVSIKKNGNVERHPNWVQFRNGLIEPADSLLHYYRTSAAHNSLF